MSGKLDFSDVILLLEAALAQARKLDGQDAIDDTVVRANRPAAAEQNRGIQVVTHWCERAATESTAILWTQKGFPDPLHQ